MKPFRLILSAAILWGLSISCNNEIDLYSDDAPEMLFVLGCLDGTGTLQQVKIRKLITGDEDAALMINDPSHYLPDITTRVYLEEASGNRVPFNRVIHPPQTGGVFSQDSNLIYEIAGYNPIPGKSIGLRIEDSAGGNYLSAQTLSMTPAFFDYPTQESALRVKYMFTDPLRPFTVIYGLAPASVLTVSLKYVDILISGDTIFRKANYTLPAHFIPHPSGGQSFELPYLWLIFDRSIQDDPTVDFRMFYRFDFTVWTGDSAIADYLLVAERFSDNRRQSFNNITGGIGLFYATSNARLKNVCPHEKFLAFLRANDTTAHLGFSGTLFPGEYIDPDSSMVNPFFSLVK